MTLTNFYPEPDRPLDRTSLERLAHACFEHGLPLDFSRITLASSQEITQQFIFLVLDGCQAREADLRGHAWSHSSFDQADLSGADFSSCGGSHCSFRYARMWAMVAIFSHFTNADFRGATLAYATLTNSIFTGATFVGADLSHACAAQSTFASADLRYANLRQADLRYTSFYCADLRGADLREANIEGAHFEGADLTDTRLSEEQQVFLAREGFTQVKRQRYQQDRLEVQRSALPPEKLSAPPQAYLDSIAQRTETRQHEEDERFLPEYTEPDPYWE